MNNIIEKICITDAEHILDDRGQPPLWPLMVEIGAWYLNRCFLSELYNTIKRLEEIGKTKDEIAFLFKAPSRLSYPMHQIHYSFQDLKGEKGKGLLLDLVDFIKFFRKEDIFCEKGQNILWANSKVKNALKTFPLLYLQNDEEGNSIRRIVGKLNTVLWLYTELITMGHHSICHEFHGPYKIDTNKWLVIREYYDLKLTDIWPFSDSMPANKIVTMEVYEDIQIKLDFFNHTESSSDLPSHLKAILIGLEKFENFLATDNIKELLNKVTESMAIGNKYIANFKEVDWVTKLIELYFYCIEPHKSLLGEDWRPTNQVYEFIQKAKPDKEFNDFMNKVGVIKSGAVSYDDARKMLVDHYLNNIGVIR